MTNGIDNTKVYPEVSGLASSGRLCFKAISRSLQSECIRRCHHLYCKKLSCVTWGFHSGEDSSGNLLSCGAVWRCGGIPIFQGSMKIEAA